MKVRLEVEIDEALHEVEVGDKIFEAMKALFGNKRAEELVTYMESQIERDSSYYMPLEI
jgi:hypothetical protein